MPCTLLYTVVVSEPTADRFLVAIVWEQSVRFNDSGRQGMMISLERSIEATLRTCLRLSPNRKICLAAAVLWLRHHAVGRAKNIKTKAF